VSRPPEPDSGSVRLDATVEGGVQGVGYRWFVLDAARRLGLAGWVANQADGSVRCVAEGPRPALEALLGELAAGPPHARVDRVATVWGAAGGTLGPFAIRAGGHRGD
jgi:acylphosphatase